MTPLRRLLYLLSALLIVAFSVAVIAPAHEMMVTERCTNTCLNHSQSAVSPMNFKGIKKDDKEPRPPEFTQFFSVGSTSLLIAASVGAATWINWYFRKLLLSTQLRF